MSDQKGKRFHIGRRVKPKPPEPYSQQVMREVETDTADRGTPEMDREVRKGCTGCVRVMALFFLIMIASIVATCAIRRGGV
ncbi:MAG TPA: hypothetical protein VD902_00460 [Symbiobacteriaceae bacterium]|nr:hypothetical protein [Symbiobacteriaceae bacterium]